MDATLRILALLAAAAAPAAAQTLEEVRWSRGEGLWTDAGGWSPEVVPNNTPEAHYHAIVPTGRTVEIPPSERIEITRLSGGGTVVAEGLLFQVSEWVASGAIVVRDGDFVAEVVRPIGAAILSLDGSRRATRIGRVDLEGDASLTVGMDAGSWLRFIESDSAPLRISGNGTSLTLESGLSPGSVVSGAFAQFAVGGTNDGAIFALVEGLWCGETFSNHGSATFTFDTASRSSGGVFSHIENSGTLVLNTTVHAFDYAPVLMDGLVNTGRVVLTGDISATTPYRQDGAVTNSGIIEIAEGGQFGSATLSAGTVVNHGSVRVSFGGGIYALSGPFINTGRIEVSMGLAADHPGPRGGYVFSDSFEQTSDGELHITLAGADTTGGGSSVDFGVYAGDRMSLAGTLTVDVLPPFQPSPGDEFFILKTWPIAPLEGVIVGSFDRIELPRLKGAAWNTDALYTEGVLRVVEACGAEWDGQPGVGAGDLLAFLADFRDGAPGADVTGDGRTDVADLLTFLGSFRAGC